MTDQVFYVGSEDRGNLTGFVPAKFMMRNGSYIVDPLPGGSQRAYLYSDGQGNDKTKGAIANPNNYLIVPANYDEAKAREFADQITELRYPGMDPDATGMSAALGGMTAAFLPGGSQDLQRHAQWGIPKGSIVPAFVGSASNHLGYVTALAGLPMDFAETGGGAANEANAAVQYLKGLRGHSSDKIDTSGPHGLSKQNYANIAQGYSDGLAAGETPAAFNDYGYYPRPQAPAAQIGGGNGISSFPESLVGVNPDEPEPPAWPPQQASSVRYLGSRVRY